MESNNFIVNLEFRIFRIKLSYFCRSKKKELKQVKSYLNLGKAFCSACSGAGGPYIKRDYALTFDVTALNPLIYGAGVGAAAGAGAGTRMQARSTLAFGPCTA